MSISAKTIRSRIHLLRGLMKPRSPEALRKAQNRLGELIQLQYRKKVLVKHHRFDTFTAAWVLPADQRREGVILYLHGGGFVCGDLEYTQAFGSVLAVQTGARVLAPAYRLAPEHPFPAALEDALEAYRYLLDKGYGPERIALCGESAGGGLCFSLCMKLQQLELPLPGSICAMSPWTDISCSGESYQNGEATDGSMSRELLSYFARCYCGDSENVMASPLLGNLTGMPPTLIFVGGEELMRSDAEGIHRALQARGCESTLVVKPQRWHAYPLYCLEEDREDWQKISRHLSRYMAPENKLRWLPLDNAAKIYPAARSQKWSNVFRLSATLTEDIDREILQSALDVTVRRFPSMGVRLRRGLFWYYLEQLDRAPRIREEHSYPLTRMSKEETRQCAFRVIVYGRRIALEMFHSITDGNGALIFLKSLVAEYLQQRYGVYIPAEDGVLGRLEAPTEEELEDSFLKHAGRVQASRRGSDAWRILGTPEPDGFLNVTSMQMSVPLLLSKAREQGVTLTTYLCAAMMMAIQNLQSREVPNPARRRHIKVLIPVNIRKMFASRSLRNFVLYTTPEIDPRLGHYTFPEICKVVHHHMGAEVTQKKMKMLMATNVSSERNLLVKMVPLFLKNPIMKMVFNLVGERKSCLSLSNLGAVKLPEPMGRYVQRLDFILGVQHSAPYNCGVISLGDTLYLNFIRNIRESELEYEFYRVLRDLGIPVTVQSNR